MKTLFIMICLTLLYISGVKAQTISGYVKTKPLTQTHSHDYEHEHDPEHETQEANPLPGANLTWANTGTGTATDANGYFELAKSNKTKLLVISYTGYKTDTLQIDKPSKELLIFLKSDAELDEVLISRKSKGEFYSVMDPVSTQVISEEGLKKLPCCDLSESFENNASVDVSFADAVSGAKQIKMLGLAGTYTQILRENIPDVRGLNANYGLNYLPGSWMQSVQISKGAATVKNGYESITGQINTELKKPESAEKLFINLYGNSELRHETNVVSAHKLSDELSTILLLHASRFQNALDHNSDGFLDMPLYERYSGVNKWKYHGKNGLESQVGLRFLTDSRAGGQMQFVEKAEGFESGYGIAVENRQYELYAKLGFPIPGSDKAGIGSVWSASVSEQNSVFGNTVYSGLQKSFYGNVIFNTSFIDEHHSLNAGGSFVYDDFDESFNEMSYKRIEKVPGVFAEYNYNRQNKFNLIMGLRSDFHNLYGTFFTPRMHIRYQVSEDLILRASGGKGFRTANIFSENMGLFASSRRMILEEDLQPEEAWNYGANVAMFFDVGVKQALSVNLDFYRTDFQNQIIADINANPQEIRFYNLRGTSYSNSVQADVGYQPNGRFSVNGAFRFTEVKTTMRNELISKPLVNQYKALLTASYSTLNEKWSFDITNLFTGSSPLPDLSLNPEEYRLPEKSEAFYTLHAQITRKFKRLEVYVGGENLTDYRQTEPIIAAENPFGEYFDASVIWGPVLGRMFYAGLRFSLP